MRITRSQYEAAYRYAQKYHKGDIEHLKDALHPLVTKGINRNSAADLIYNFGHLMDGRIYKRSMSVDTTNDYLSWILRDYGIDALRKALSGLSQHIEYCRQQNGASLKRLMLIRDKFQSELYEAEEFVSPEEISPQEKYVEGKTKTITVDKYERCAAARKKCIATFGPSCSVCQFDFELMYGTVGLGFTHVHHLNELALIAKEYEVVPERDLRPVCPNCHAMLHKRKPAYSIQELKALIDSQKDKH